ncbi:hypothetical protein JCM11251_000046 [Rhodosporidiobolus azoricus]
MSSRTKLARKAATAKSYAAQLYGSSDEVDSAADEVGENVKRFKRSKGKGKARTSKHGGSMSSDEDEDEPWGKKRQARKGKSRKRGKENERVKPQVDLLKTMPMDMLVEIFSYLLPSELLALSRTSKPYRELLTAKQAKSVWRASRRLINMPDLGAGDMSEMAYAHLMFGKKCEACGKGRTGRADHFLRVRLCPDCAKDNYVKLSTIRKTHPQFHPSTAQVVMSTPRMPSFELLSSNCLLIKIFADSASSNRKWSRGKYRFALRADLDYYSKHLYELHDEDEAIMEAASLKPAASLPVSTRSGRSSRSRPSLSTAEEAATREDDVEVLHTDLDGSLVSAFVKSRKALIERVNKDGQLLDARYDALAGNIKQHVRDFWSMHWQQRATLQRQDSFGKRVADERELHRRREYDLRCKLLELDVGTYNILSSFDCKTWRTHKLVDCPKTLTDEEWLEIKDDILELAKLARAEYEDWAAKREKQAEWLDVVDERVEKIEARFAAYRASQLNESARFTLPHQADLLLFDSIKLLQLPTAMEDDFDATRADLSDKEWTAALPFIEEELDEHRVNLFLHAVRLILSATMEGDLPDADEILNNLGEYDDAFFDRATSFLCCDKGCFRRGEKRSYWMREDIPVRSTFIGSLPTLLEHQHSQHSDSMHRSSRPEKDASPMHFSLPLEISCAMSALIELGDLDERTAGVEELDAMDQSGSYVWENSHCGRKNYPGWRELLDAVYRESKRYSAMKPPRSMAPACIVYHQCSAPPPDYAKEEDDSDEAQLGCSPV